MISKLHLDFPASLRATLLWLLMTVFAAFGAQAPPGAAGHWEGDIAVPGSKLAVRVDLKQESGGAWAGTIDIPAQSLRAFKLGAIAVDGSAVRFEMPGIPGIRHSRENWMRRGRR
jgi:hypothetical protein